MLRHQLCWREPKTLRWKYTSSVDFTWPKSASCTKITHWQLASIKTLSEASLNSPRWRQNQPNIKTFIVASQRADRSNINVRSRKMGAVKNTDARKRWVSFFFFFKQKKKQWLGNELHKYLRSPGLHFLLKCSLLFPKRLMLAIPERGGHAVK